VRHASCGLECANLRSQWMPTLHLELADTTPTWLLLSFSTCHQLLWTKSMPSRNPVLTPTSPTRTAPKPSYSQVAIRRPPKPTTRPGQRPSTKENLQPCDPGKSPPHDLTCDSSHDQTHDLSHDPQALKQACDQTHDLPARDCGNLTHDLPRDWSSTRSPDHARFLHASCPLIHMWKTVGTINS